MKKILSLILFIGMLISLTGVAQAASTAYNAKVKTAITKYKARNYTGCIQDLTEVTKHDPSNAVAHYYLANSYMKIGRKDVAIKEFDKVISINSVPVLSAYSLQAKDCISTGICTYKRFSNSDAKAYVKDPDGFLQKIEDAKAQAAATSASSKESESTTVAAKVQQAIQEQQSKKGSELTPEEVQEVTNKIMQEKADEIEIQKLINGRYKNNIHPDAQREIIDAKLKIEKESINQGQTRSDIPTNEEIANAVKTLARAGFTSFTPPQNQAYQGNDKYTALNMMYANQNQNNDFMNMLPYLTNRKENEKIDPQTVKAMMMSTMMPDFNFEENSQKY